MGDGAGGEENAAAWEEGGNPHNPPLGWGLWLGPRAVTWPLLTALGPA